MGRMLVAALVGAVLMFIWGFVSHTVLKLFDVKGFSNSGALIEMFKTSQAESGVYSVPAMPADMSDSESPQNKKFVEDYEEGPIAIVYYQKEGATYMGAMTFIKGFLVMFASCVFAAFLVSRSKLASTGGRFALVVCLGVLMAIHVDGSNWAWMLHPVGWTIASMIDHVAAWAAAGVGIAVILRPQVTVR
jgi:hypothetical protein